MAFEKEKNTYIYAKFKEGIDWNFGLSMVRVKFWPLLVEKAGGGLGDHIA